jgi:hypothetical protein
MVDRRQVLRGLLLAGAGLALPAGCGVPGGGGPIVDGPGPTYDQNIEGKDAPPDPAAATTQINAVRLFLAAISGPLETPELRGAARERARKFLTGGAGRAWQPSTDQVTVVRVENLTTWDVTKVVGDLQPVGVLQPARGEVQGYTDGSTAPVRVEFTVVPNATQTGYLIDKLPLDLLPPGLLLSSVALEKTYFTPQVIYFWDKDQRALVPDLRYVPRVGVPESQQKAYIVNWLIGDPSELISSVALSIVPSGTQLKIPSVLTEGDRLVVNLTGALGALKAEDLDKVMAQLRWSLQPQSWVTGGSVELQIASRPQRFNHPDDFYRAANPADLIRDEDAQPFCVVDGVISAVDSGYPVPAVLAAPEHNRTVLQAALSRDKQRAALVTGEHRLRLGQAGQNGAAPSFTDVPLTGQRWSRPMFLPSGQRLLVAVDGVLYAITSSNQFTPVQENVTAFAVSPDGYRIALVGRGAVRVAALHDGDRVTIGTPRPLDAGRQDVTGLAWTRLDRLVVAGHAPGGYGLTEVSLDGVVQNTWTNTFRSPIASVVAYPKLPSQIPGPGPVMVQTDNGAAYRVFAYSEPKSLTIQESKPGPSPSPSTTPVTKPPPTAPFFAD